MELDETMQKDNKCVNTSCKCENCDTEDGGMEGVGRGGVGVGIGVAELGMRTAAEGEDEESREAVAMERGDRFEEDAAVDDDMTAEEAENKEEYGESNVNEEEAANEEDVGAEDEVGEGIGGATHFHIEGDISSARR